MMMTNMKRKTVMMMVEVNRIMKGWQGPRQLINQSQCFGENSLSAPVDGGDDDGDDDDGKRDDDDEEEK